MNVTKMAKRALVLAFLSASLFSTSSFATDGTAAWVFDPALMYIFDHTQFGGGSSVDTSRFLLDLNVGYRFASPLYVGLLYTMDNKTVTQNPTTTDQMYAYGPTVGLATDSFYLLATFYVGSQDSQNNGAGTTTTFSGGTGFQASLGYHFPLTADIFLGPQLNYRSIHYTSVSSNSSATDYTYASLVPYVDLWFNFD